MQEKTKERKIKVDGFSYILENEKIIGVITESKTKWALIFKPNILKNG
jgi:hypothetical protein